MFLLHGSMSSIPNTQIQEKSSIFGMDFLKNDQAMIMSETKSKNTVLNDFIQIYHNAALYFFTWKKFKKTQTTQNQKNTFLCQFVI